MTHSLSTRPSGFLVDNMDLLPVGRALDIAMGGGRNAVYLAGLGFTVEGVDISHQAVVAAMKLAGERGVTITAVQGDLEKGYKFSPGAYDVIICFNYLQRNLIPSIKDGIRTGGVVVYETYTVDQRRFGRPRNPDHLLERNELLGLFRDFRCLRYREGIIGGKKAAAGIVAEKVEGNT